MAKAPDNPNPFKEPIERVRSTVKTAAKNVSARFDAAKGAVQRGAAERQARNAAKPAEKPMRVLGATKAETSAKLDAVKANRTSMPVSPLRKAAVPASATKNVGTVKAGAFPVYKKDSAQAGSFREEFAKARAAGKKDFLWNGRSYNTKTK